MDSTLLAVVVVTLVVSQSGVIAATANDETVAAVVQHDDGVPGVDADSAPGPIQSADVPRPERAVTLAADLAETIRGLPPEVLLAVIGYSRHGDSDPLEHGVRRAVYDAVIDSPGTYISELATECDIPASTVRYHVRILEDESLVETSKILGKRRVFEAGEAEAGILTALNDPVTAAVLKAVDREEPASVSALAESLDRTPSTASYHVSRLEESGLIVRERDGERVLVSLTASTRKRFDGNSGTTR